MLPLVEWYNLLRQTNRDLLKHFCLLSFSKSVTRSGLLIKAQNVCQRCGFCAKNNDCKSQKNACKTYNICSLSFNVCSSNKRQLRGIGWSWCLVGRWGSALVLHGWLLLCRLQSFLWPSLQSAPSWRRTWLCRGNMETLWLAWNTTGIGQGGWNRILLYKQLWNRGSW